MAKIRSDYEGSRLARFLDWVNGGSQALDRRIEERLSERTAPDAPAALREERREEQSQWRHLREMEDERVLYQRMRGWMDRSGSRWIARGYRLLASLVAVLIIGALLLTVLQMPPFGTPDRPTQNEVSLRYDERGLAETGATNNVAGMILDYRAFDTLGESNVLFIAVCSVFLLLRVKLDAGGRITPEQRDAAENDRRFEPHEDAILQRMADVLVPVVLLFGMYVVVNGHLSPGGGFSGGAVMGAGLILYLNAHGYTGTRRFRLFGYGAFKWITFAALMFYCLSKCYSFFTGANGLESVIGPGTPGSIFSAGLILPLNICVGFVVAFTMYGFYTLFRKGDF